MASRRRLQNEIKKLLAQYDSEVRKAFLQAIRDRTSSIDLTQLAEAIEQGNLARAIDIAGLSRADLFLLDQTLVAAYAAGGRTVAQAAPTFAVTFGFDGRAVRAEQWARQHVGGLVTEIIADQREMLREVIASQVADGIGPRQVATRIAGPIGAGNVRQGGFIGLTSAQARYVDKARNELATLDPKYFERKLRDRRFDPLIRKAIKDNKNLSLSDINRITSRYSDRLLKHRAEVIARTESVTALRAGRREGILQAIDAGAVKADSLKRRWDATLDSRTRPDHVAMHGQEVSGPNEAYVLPDGSRMLYPGDTSLGASASQAVMCRCYEEHVVDWLRG